MEVRGGRTSMSVWTVPDASIVSFLPASGGSGSTARDLIEMASVGRPVRYQERPSAP